MTSNTTTASAEHGELRHLDPHTLVIEDNVRTETINLSPEFIASIADEVQQPVLAVEVDGEVRVRDGQRRTLAAREAGRATIPVYVKPLTETDDKTQTAKRLVDQLVANKHREGLSAKEEVAAVEQMMLAGMSATKIAKSVRTSKKAIDAMLATAKSAAAADALDSGLLTLEQSAVVAAYDADGDDIAAARLVTAAHRGQFEHVAQHLAATAEQRAQVRAMIAELTTAGIEATAMRPDFAGPAVSIHRLVTADGDAADIEDIAVEHRLAYVSTDYRQEWRDAEGNTVDPDRIDMWLEDHDETEQPEDGLLDPRTLTKTTESFADIDWYVTDLDAAGVSLRNIGSASAGAESPADTEAKKEADKKERRQTIALNKQAVAAAEVRKTKVREYLARKTLPKGKAGEVTAFLATTMWHNSDLFTYNRQDGNAKELATEFLGGTTPLDALATASTERRHVINLAIAIGGHEADMPKAAWRETDRSYTQHRKTYLDLLVSVFGYEMSDVEKVITGDLAADDVDLD